MKVTLNDILDRLYKEVPEATWKDRGRRSVILVTVPFENASKIRAILTGYKTVSIVYETGEDTQFQGEGWALRAVTYGAPKEAGIANLVKVFLSGESAQIPNDYIRAWNVAYHESSFGSDPVYSEQLNMLTRILLARMEGKGFPLDSSSCLTTAIADLTRFASTYRKLNGQLDENLCEVMCRLARAQPEVGLRELLNVAKEALREPEKVA